MTFTDRVCRCIASIPGGKVCSYGMVAAAVGSPRSARQIVRILHTQSHKRNLPWHRVVNKEGRIALPMPGYLEQKALLEAEGIIFDKNDVIDLELFAYHFDSEPAMILIDDLTSQEDQ